jgi:hypothetical protein
MKEKQFEKSMSSLSIEPPIMEMRDDERKIEYLKQIAS